MNRIISAPLVLDPIVPSNWDTWWKVWKEHAKFIRKPSSNHNPGQAYWQGMDIFVKDGFDSDSTGYISKNANCPDLFPSLFDNLDKLPIEVDMVRAGSSFYTVAPHSDSTAHMLSVRTLLYTTNTKPTFYFQWDDKKAYQQLPETTNTFFYWDNEHKHGTDFYPGRTKILLMFYGKEKENGFNNAVARSEEVYKDFIIYR
jgi:hypothetical protein